MYAYKAKKAARENQQQIDAQKNPTEYNLNTALFCISESLEHLEREVEQIKRTVDKIERYQP